MSLRQEVAIVGIGWSKVYRRAEVPLGALALDACKEAIKDAGVKASDIDGVSCAPHQPFGGAGTVNGVDLVNPSLVIQALDLDVRWTERCEGMITHSLINTINMVRAGACNYALVFRALHNPSGRYSHINPKQIGGPGQYTAPYGISGGMDQYASLMQGYMDKYGAQKEDVGRFVVNNRQMALKFPYGYWYQHRPEVLTLDDYMTSRTITGPMSLYDCDMPIQGAGAFVITTGERARDLKNPPAYVRGMATDAPEERGLFTPLEDYMESGKKTIGRLWKDSGLTLSDVDVLNFYDGYSILTPLWAEVLGLCKEGEAFSWVASPTVPLNTSSGNLGAGRLHGFPHLADGAYQVMGRSGPRQVKDAEFSLVTIAPCPGQAVIFGKDPH